MKMRTISVVMYLKHMHTVYYYMCARAFVCVHVCILAQSWPDNVCTHYVSCIESEKNTKLLRY